MIEILNWNDNFETSESRKLKTRSWYPCPTKFDGLGQRKIKRKSLEFWAVWNELCKLAARCNREGKIADENDVSLSLEDISIKIDIPEETISAAVKYIESEIKWIKFRDDIPESPRSHPGPIPVDREKSGDRGQDRTGQDRTGQDTNAAKAASVFEDFRKIYPGDKRGHKTEFDRLKKHNDWKDVLPKLKPTIESQMRARGPNYAFWPHMATWLNNRQWELEITSRGQQQSNPSRVPVQPEDLGGIHVVDCN